MTSPNADKGGRYEWGYRRDSNSYVVTCSEQLAKAVAASEGFQVVRRPVPDWQVVYQSLSHIPSSETDR